MDDRNALLTQPDRQLAIKGADHHRHSAEPVETDQPVVDDLGIVGIAEGDDDVVGLVRCAAGDLKQREIVGQDQAVAQWRDLMGLVALGDEPGGQPDRDLFSQLDFFCLGRRDLLYLDFHMVCLPGQPTQARGKMIAAQYDPCQGRDDPFVWLFVFCLKCGPKFSPDRVLFQESPEVTAGCRFQIVERVVRVAPTDDLRWRDRHDPVRAAVFDERLTAQTLEHVQVEDPHEL
ncbi:hypothetical protein A7A08_00499 [Methyloligella halotolerans]|uniref:Uncharacterized protein n=1 Tax=Methyloligella halotolerans TaxID=1177755 RepID=A0A1E2S2F6_9HYPH|nr:hypothetical protein [Methyloligella halotolerans]ODA68667.1 hypothetical protein A7A08_00499 [Methyloligella halotolerans]